jgi:hypothetical protein
METTTKIREQIGVVELNNNFQLSIELIQDLIEKNDYYLKVNGSQVVDGKMADLSDIKPDFGNLSGNARKNLAKRIHFLMKKKSLKSINTFFFIFRKLGVITENVKVEISRKEKNINNLRSTYKIMKAKTEEARLAYKKEKGNFYKEKLA